MMFIRCEEGRKEGEKQDWTKALLHPNSVAQDLESRQNSEDIVFTSQY